MMVPLRTYQMEDPRLEVWMKLTEVGTKALATSRSFDDRDPIVDGDFFRFHHYLLDWFSIEERRHPARFCISLVRAKLNRFSTIWKRIIYTSHC